MEENKEISALFHLIDDPDEEVFTTVSERIVSFGKGNYPQPGKPLGKYPRRK